MVPPSAPFPSRWCTGALVARGPQPLLLANAIDDSECPARRIAEDVRPRPDPEGVAERGAGAEEAQTVETADSAGEIQDTHVFWTPGPPAGAAAELFTRLAQRGLLLEPFERAGEGLRVVFGDPLGSRK